MATATRTRAAAADQPDPIWLSNDEAAKLMNIKPSTLNVWRSTKRPGRPPAHRLGRHVSYDKHEILAWIAAQKEQVKDE